MFRSRELPYGARQRTAGVALRSPALVSRRSVGCRTRWLARAACFVRVAENHWGSGCKSRSRRRSSLETRRTTARLIAAKRNVRVDVTRRGVTMLKFWANCLLPGRLQRGSFFPRLSQNTRRMGVAQTLGPYFPKLSTLPRCFQQPQVQCLAQSSS